MEQKQLQIRFGNRVRSVRLANGISQESLANTMEMSRNGLSKIENGKLNVSLDTIRRLADALQCTLAELMPDYPRE